MSECKPTLKAIFAAAFGGGGGGGCDVFGLL